ncbi:hypothetical protein DEU56DRAFT_760952 [Suillus clintonianus]|uniref:uncharacterized protein n=1 Tax=Suillus clintonianus TaxID=1904413 RepID=UPI001B87C32C|nr:uncharacterized protein DEU56DRAFT_760952 [Suillus clintonianus]KAG2119435.1 hypothetical protein DEU56DRAFT_760952 [Suillus clintonianus]
MSIHIISFPARFRKFHDAYLRLSQQFHQIRSLYIVIKDWAIDVLIKSLDYDPWNYRTLEIFIAIAVVLLCVVRFWPTSSPRPTTKDSQHARTALQALQTVLVPSCSLWPARYIQLVKHASNHRFGSRIVIPLSLLLQDVCDGVIELRDPLYDLEDLIHGGVCAYGCSLRGDVLVTSAQHLDGLKHPLLAKVPPPSVDHWPTINLDGHPLSHLLSIRLPQGSHTTLEFTSLSSHISFLSTTYIVCMVPFLARRLPHQLSDILATVNGTRHFKLSTLTNTSATYAETLAALSTTLTYDSVARKHCVDELGVKGWRKRKLMLEFEAALVRRGWLERWNVVLEGR